MKGRPDDTITAVILAGGQARRMGGIDKGLIKIDGVAMVQRIAQQLQEQHVDIIINANRNLDEYRKFGFAVIEDTLSNYQGPLAGMLAGLKYVETPWMITAPCDGPFISQQYVQKMWDAIQDSQTLLAVASCDTRLQPVYTLLNKSLANNLESFLETGDRKIDRWFNQLPYTVIDFSDSPKMFTNMNTREQLQDFEKTRH